MSRRAGASDLVEIAGQVEGGTGKAIRFFDGARTVWLAKEKELI